MEMSDLNESGLPQQEADLTNQPAALPHGNLSGSVEPQYPARSFTQYLARSLDITNPGLSRQETDLTSQPAMPLRQDSSANATTGSEWESIEEEFVPEYKRIDEHPTGYPRMAAFMDSHEKFLICRQYGVLHNRVLLHRQDELRSLELELFQSDERIWLNDQTQLASREREGRFSPERHNLIDRIDEKLKQYKDIVERARYFATLQKSSERNHGSVRNWIYNTAPIVQEEAMTFNRDRDFVSLVEQKEGSRLEGRVEMVLSKFSGSISRRLFVSKRDREDETRYALVQFYSKERITAISRVIAAFLSVVLLMLAPVVALYFLNDHAPIKIVVIFMFTMIFSIALSLLTKAKAHEMFAATAAYCAVLVVFLGNIDN